MCWGGAIRSIAFTYPFVPSSLRVVLLFLMPLRKKMKLLLDALSPKPSGELWVQ